MHVMQLGRRQPVDKRVRWRRRAARNRGVEIADLEDLQSSCMATLNGWPSDAMAVEATTGCSDPQVELPYFGRYGEFTPGKPSPEPVNLGTLRPLQRVQLVSRRGDGTETPAARTSKGFLVAGTRVASSR